MTDEAQNGLSRLADTRLILTSAELDRLRAGFDPEVLRAANVGAFAAVYPPMAAWGEVASAVFFGSETLTARERELCIIGILTARAPGLSLANHVYWGLMEGLGVAEICEAVGLAGCYCGMPSFSQGIITVQRTLYALKVLAGHDECHPRAVLSALTEAFASDLLR